MIYIIDYDKKGAKEAFESVKKCTDKVEISKNELKIIGSEKIILPDTSTPENALKKLHLFNLYSALRIYQKPILGIGAGFALMCQGFNEQNALGFFNCKARGSNSELEVFDLRNNKKIIGDNLKLNNYWGIYSLSDREEFQKVIKEFVEF